MTLNEYQALVANSRDEVTDSERFMWLAEEAGEAVGACREWMFRGVGSYQKVREELGDVIWAVSEIASAFRIPLEQIMEENAAKIRARFPERFNADGSRK